MEGKKIQDKSSSSRIKCFSTNEASNPHESHETRLKLKGEK